MKPYLVAVFTAATMAVSVHGYAHHSFAATYFENRSVTIEGELVQFIFRNPHSFVHLIVTEKNGSRVRYAVEWHAAGELGWQGVTGASLKPGDHVIITGTPGRDPADHRVRLTSLRRPKDGFGWAEQGAAMN